jgi:hypothetical protein
MEQAMSHHTTKELADILKSSLKIELIDEITLPGKGGGEGELNRLFPCLKRESSEKYDFVLDDSLIEMKKNRFGKAKRSGELSGGGHFDLHKLANVGEDEFLMLVGTDNNWKVIWIGLVSLRLLKEKLLSDAGPSGRANGWSKEAIELSVQLKKLAPHLQTKAPAYNIRQMFEEQVGNEEFQVVFSR